MVIFTCPTFDVDDEKSGCPCLAISRTEPILVTSLKNVIYYEIALNLSNDYDGAKGVQFSLTDLSFLLLPATLFFFSSTGTSLLPLAPGVLRPLAR